MRGHVRFKDGAWRLTVDAGTHADGRRRQVHRTVRADNTRAGRQQADVALAKLIVELDADVSPPPAPEATMGLSAFFEGYVARHGARWAPSTRATDPGLWDRHVHPVLGEVALRDLRRSNIAHLHQVVAEKMAPASVLKVHRLVHRVLADAVMLELIPANPASAVKPPRVPKPSVRPPSDAELDAIIAAIDREDPQFLTLVLLDAELGARRGELSALRWPDVDLETGAVTVSRALSNGGAGVGLVERHTKEDERHVVAVSPAVVAELRGHRARRLKACMAAGVRMDDGGFVFVPPREPVGDVPLRPDGISYRFRKAREAAGVSGVRFHDLRHYVASTLLAGGVDIRTVSHRLGHSSPNTTLAIYSHLIPAADRAAAEILAAKRRRVQDGSS